MKRIDLQHRAYSREENIPETLFRVLETQKEELLALKERHGSIVSPDLLPA